MDRTAEYKFLIPKSSESPLIKEQKFYEELYSKLREISQKANRPVTHKAILLLDQEFSEFIKKTSVLLESIKINGEQDIKANFEGIKFIINCKMAQVSKEISISKTKVSNMAIELEPERPINLKKVNENLLYEQENRVILETTQYEATKQRLLKIEVVQRAIQENLLIQDERIDGICTSNSATSSLYETLLGDEDFYNGSFIKRSAFTILICLTFVLIFLHLYYRK